MGDIINLNSVLFKQKITSVLTFKGSFKQNSRVGPSDPPTKRGLLAPHVFSLDATFSQAIERNAPDF